MGAGPGGLKSGSPLRGQQHPEGIVPVGDSHSRRERKRRHGGTVELLRGIPRRSEERRARIESQPWHESPRVWACARKGGSSLARVRLAGVCGAVFLPKSEKRCFVAVDRTSSLRRLLLRLL